MPDRIDLERRLAGGRATLLAEITQPPLDRVSARAAAIRRRRRAGRAGAVLAVVIVGFLLVRPDGGTPAPRVAGPPPTARAPVYSASGLTLNGIPDPQTAPELPGLIAAVEFADPEHGYAASSCVAASGPCRPRFARTDDGGRTWTTADLPGPDGAPEVPDLVAFGAGRVLLRAGQRTYASVDGGRTWRPAGVSGGPVAAARGGDVLRADGVGEACAGGRVEVWTPESGPPGPLAAQPGLDACGVTAGPGRTWWAGGSVGGRAAVAVSGDGGGTWRRSVFPVTGAARVAVLGPHVYALVTGANQAAVAVFHSADEGRTFHQTGGAAALPSPLVGDLVPLLDGRLLIAGADREWLVSGDDGATFEPAVGNLPVVGWLARTGAGYVAYDLFGSGWTAFSTDGTTWRKLELR